MRYESITPITPVMNCGTLIAKITARCTDTLGICTKLTINHAATHINTALQAAGITIASLRSPPANKSKI